MDETPGRDRNDDPTRTAREQAEVAAALSRAREGRVDETAVNGEPPASAAPAASVPATPPQAPSLSGSWGAPSGQAAMPPAPPWSRPGTPGEQPGSTARPVGPDQPGSAAQAAYQHGRTPQPAGSHQPNPTNRYDSRQWHDQQYARQHDGSAWQPPAGPTRQTGPGDRRRPGWAALAGTAAAAALLASVGTATFTGAFDNSATTAGTVEQTQPAQTVPVNATAQQPDWQSVAAAVRESVVAIEVRTAGGGGAGSGVLLDDAGHVLTNSHVVDGARGGEVVVSLSDGRMYEAEVVGQDETTDLAVLALADPPGDLVPATFGSSAELVVGEPIAAVGNPLGLDSTVTTGIVSALDRPVVTQSESASVVTNAVQVDAAINPGNSGGPLFNAQGEVIGITSSIATLSGGSASGSIGLGFAIPVDQASAVASQLVEDGTVEHAFLGVGLSDTAVTVDDVTRQGAQVRQVEAGSPAEEAGLQREDVITEIDGRSVDGAPSLTGYVRQHSAGEKVVLTVVRDGAADEVPVTLAAREQVLQ